MHLGTFVADVNMFTLGLLQKLLAAYDRWDASGVKWDVPASSLVDIVASPSCCGCDVRSRESSGLMMRWRSDVIFIILLTYEHEQQELIANLTLVCHIC